MSAFAIYRLPHEEHATLIRQTSGEPLELHSLPQLNGLHGFVVAPFEVKADQPVLLIQGETERVENLGAMTPSRFPSSWEERLRVGERSSGMGLGVVEKNAVPSSFYSIDFANYHSQLEAESFRKIVLARCADERLGEGIEPMDLFYRACAMYPRLFIALVDTPQSGCWLTATPEILLDGKGSEWRTIALAGTMKLEGEQLNGEGESLTWSTKNIQEQRIVSTYITECLEQFTSDFREDGPRSVRAANLVHLRSDFTFKLADNEHIGDLLQALHPTPAVCGLPKRETFNFIISNEHTPRRYYSGFMGPLGLDETHLYVSLRCMNIEDSICHLYAGGGLLKDSILEQEWLETEAKLQTMRQLLTE